MGVIFPSAFYPEHFEENDPFKCIGDDDFGSPSFWKFTKENWNPNLSKVSNRANILNKWYEKWHRKPYYPMLPNGELDVEAFKLKLEKENKKHQEELRKAREREKERAEEEVRIAYANSFLGKLDKFLTSMFLFFRK